ncbi:YibE/F family protein [Amnibacterium endophyticum]|uniref:YibE/F family protein n=1 Tax=Amnibacterium endophyticum TaxID=2109337 RepID=A0ABW4LHM8_9MICO
MGHGHQHGEAPDLRLRRWSRTAVVVVVVLAGLAALLGMAQTWPDASRVDRLQGRFPYAAPGVTIVHARLLDVRTACSGSEAPGTTACGDSRARILDGRSRGRTVPLALTPDVVATHLRAGDRILVLDTAAAAQPGLSAGSPGSAFSFYRADRGSNLIWLAVLFALAVVLVAWRRGLMALLGLGFAGVVVVGFLIPALLSGRPAVPATLSASVLILIVLLYATHGISMRTSVALVGALIGLAMSVGFAWFGVIGSRLAGVGDDAAGLLTFNVRWIDVQQLVVASVVLAGLGTLNDVTVTQASALWEPRAAAPATRTWRLFLGAMRIGRDHVASTVYTLVFAYLGTAVVLLVAVQLSAGTPGDLLTSEDVALEIVRTLVGGLALVLAMPVTTAIGALVVAGAQRLDEPAAAPSRPRDARRAPGPQYRRSSPVPAHLPSAGDELRRFPTDPWGAD